MRLILIRVVLIYPFNKPEEGWCWPAEFYWQLFEPPVCEGFARFFAFVLRNVGH